ncbi:MAG: alpha-isopropylmalate synthase regulatory domain-containing protein, partial [Marmoricola sp.]
DYKVRILTGSHGTDAVTRVLLDSSDHAVEWTTVGVHGNIVEASWLALCDALAHKSMRESIFSGGRPRPLSGHQA